MGFSVSGDSGIKHVAFQVAVQSCTTCFYKSNVLQQFSSFQAHDREGAYVKNVVHKELLLR